MNEEGSHPERREMGPARGPLPIAAGSDLNSLGDYALHLEREGFASIRQISSGEIMHLRTSPIEEARELYVKQSGLAQLLAQSETPIVVWDVGLGGAANAIAAIECYEQQAAKSVLPSLTIVSFENDLDSLALALRNPEKFPYLHHPAPSAILEEGRWQPKEYPNLSWLLARGDFAQTISKSWPPPDIVFYDMFSSKCYPEHWTRQIFHQLFAVCGDRATRFVTYSRSTSARVALLAAGFYVARGRASGAQEESTIALTPAAVLSDHTYELLDSQWLGKWERSRARYPAGLAEDERAALEQLIRNHPQFQSSRKP